MKTLRLTGKLQRSVCITSFKNGDLFLLDGVVCMKAGDRSSYVDVETGEVLHARADTRAQPIDGELTWWVA